MRKAVRFNQPGPEAARTTAGRRVPGGRGTRYVVVGGGGGGGAALDGRHARRDVGQVAAAGPGEDCEAFGFMAPCWRLLQRAKAYMGEVRCSGMLGGGLCRLAVRGHGGATRGLQCCLEGLFSFRCPSRRPVSSTTCVHVVLQNKYPQQLTGMCCRDFPDSGAPCSCPPFRTSSCT